MPERLTPNESAIALETIKTELARMLIPIGAVMADFAAIQGDCWTYEGRTYAVSVEAHQSIVGAIEKVTRLSMLLENHARIKREREISVEAPRSRRKKRIRG
jgi:hypothetical protein